MQKIVITIFLSLLGLILVAYAAGAPLLKIFGTRTMGTITDVRRQGGERNETVRNQYNYGVGYCFKLPDGRQIEGGATVVGSSYSSGVTKGLSPVRYLKAWPRINLLEKYNRFSIGNIILGAVGVLLIVLGLEAQKAEKKPQFICTEVATTFSQPDERASSGTLRYDSDLQYISPPFLNKVNAVSTGSRSIDNLKDLFLPPKKVV